MKKRILSVFLSLLLLLSLAACGQTDTRQGDVVVLFTNDVHCAIDESIGYAGVAAYKKDLQAKHDYVVTVDCGDFAQGAYEGAVSKGEYIVDLMNAVGYDFAIFGNHEFDYGLEQLRVLVQRSDAQFLNCNVTYTGSGEDWLATETKPYEIATYGKMKVAFIGVSTPWSLSSSTPTRFMEDGQCVYEFGQQNGEQGFYETVQKNVDACREKGADYVIVLAHLGTNMETDTPYTSPELIAHTTGIDAVLDAHAHQEASCWIRQNRDGEDVLLSSTGQKLGKIGQLVLTADGTASVGYIDNYEKKDDAITKQIADLRVAFEEQMNAVVGHLDIDLSCSDADGIRMVRSREIPIGDFAADAYRFVSGADIGMCNSGGIRADLKSGDITYQDLIDVHPFGNALCVVKVTGQEILDMLEYFYRYVQPDYKKDGKAWGEDGSFQHVSGLKFTIHTDVQSTAEADDADMFIGVAGERRISDVMVLQGADYVPIDPEATYTLASQNYMIKNGGSGMLYFMADHELVIDESISDYQILMDYLDMLNGDFSQYKTADNRITIEP